MYVSEAQKGQFGQSKLVGDKVREAGSNQTMWDLLAIVRNLCLF